MLRSYVRDWIGMARFHKCDSSPFILQLGFYGTTHVLSAVIIFSNREWERRKPKDCFGKERLSAEKERESPESPRSTDLCLWFPRQLLQSTDLSFAVCDGKMHVSCACVICHKGARRCPDECITLDHVKHDVSRKLLFAGLHICSKHCVISTMRLILIRGFSIFIVA